MPTRQHTFGQQHLWTTNKEEIMNAVHFYIDFCREQRHWCAVGAMSVCARPNHESSPKARQKQRAEAQCFTGSGRYTKARARTTTLTLVQRAAKINIDQSSMLFFLWARRERVELFYGSREDV